MPTAIASRFSAVLLFGFLATFLSFLAVFPASGLAGNPAYKIISQDGAAGALRVSVRLDSRQSEADLKAIANEVRARLPAQKVVRSVAFYLAGMPLSAAAWAEVSEQPVQKVSVAGLRLEEEVAYRAQAASDNRNRVGVWLTSPPALPGRLTIYRDAKGKVFAEWQLRSGQTTTDALIETRSNRGRRYDITGGDGGYYQLGTNGSLELGNGKTVIAVAEPLTLDAAQNQAPVAQSRAGETPGKVSVPPAAILPSAVPPAASAKPGTDASAVAAAPALTHPAKPKRSVKYTAAAKAARPAGRLSRRAEAAPGDAIRRSLSQ